MKVPTEVIITDRREKHRATWASSPCATARAPTPPPSSGPDGQPARDYLTADATANARLSSVPSHFT